MVKPAHIIFERAHHTTKTMPFYIYMYISDLPHSMIHFMMDPKDCRNKAIKCRPCTVLITNLLFGACKFRLIHGTKETNASQGSVHEELKI